MPLLSQVLRLCTAALALGVLLLVARGLPRPAAASKSTHMCAATASASPASAVWIGQREARALLGAPGIVFVDCRRRDQFQAGHISDAISMPSDKDIASAALESLRGAHTIIAYCDGRGGCESSHRLAARLRELGLDNVRILRDGLPGWLRAGYPAESGPCRLCTESQP